MRDFFSQDEKQSRRVTLRRRVLAGATAPFLGVSMLLTAPLISPAQAVDLPTWDDVQAAKNNEAAQQQKIAELESFLAENNKKLDAARNVHATKIAAQQKAEAEYEDAANKANKLVEQYKQSVKKRDQAAKDAGAIVSQMYRSGGVDRSLELFLDSKGSETDKVLRKAEIMAKASERNTKIAEDAELAANAVSSLKEQWQVAKRERDDLRQKAEKAAQEAAEAVASQEKIVSDLEAKQQEAQVMLEALKDTTTKTVQGYQERLRIEEEQRRKAAEEAQRRAAEAAAAASQGGGGYAPPSGGGGAVIAPSGWVKPVNAGVTEGFRPPSRPNHTGIDLGAACWTPILAANSGTVAFAGWYDNFGGNMVYLNQDDGYQTRYAHMIQWPDVRAGQRVAKGQVLGYVGQTGMAYGCHLHFEVKPGYSMAWAGFVDPYPFIF